MIYKQLIDGIAKLTLGNSTVDSVLADEGRVGFRRYRKLRSRTRMLNREFNASGTCLENLYDVYLEHHSPVTLPVALISQIQRSGGSLLSQLFDGHPELHAHPYELKTGYPKKYLWPKIDLNDRPEHWFEVLFEDNVIKDFREGYKKGPKYDTTFPFIFLPSLQRKLFMQSVDSGKAVTLRDIFDAYMTSYFSAWINNQNRSGEKKFITAFTPRLTMMEDNMESFFSVYPDGRLISIVRDPRNWFPSACRHKIKKKKYQDITSALMQWKKSARAMLRDKERYGDRVCIIMFEDLINTTESVMRYLADFLGIEFDRVLLVPTFNKSPIKANTSFKLEKPGIMTSTLSRYTTLGKEELDIIDTVTREPYQAVLDKAVVF
jgi:hypothetical protein